MQDKQVQELFAPPVGLEFELEVEGVKLYSSAKLKGNFLIAIAKSSKARHVYNEIASLLKNGLIVPCFQQKGILRFLKNKFFGSVVDENVVAFFHIPTKRVIVLIDNSSTVFGTSSNNAIASTTLHECMHLISSRNVNRFVSSFHNELVSFYSSFFKEYLNLKEVPKQGVEDFIKHITKYEAEGPSYANRDLVNFHNLIVNSFKDYALIDENAFIARVTNLTVPVKLFLVSMTAFINNMRNYPHLFTSLNRAYKNVFGKKNKYTVPIQELISVSEVACVLAEMKSKHPAIKRLLSIIS